MNIKLHVYYSVVFVIFCKIHIRLLYSVQVKFAQTRARVSRSSITGILYTDDDQNIILHAKEQMLRGGYTNILYVPTLCVACRENDVIIHRPLCIHIATRGNTYAWTQPVFGINVTNEYFKIRLFESNKFTHLNQF